MKFLKSSISALLISIILIFTVSGQDHQDWTYNLSIYEVNVRQYTNSSSFNEFETHLDRLKDMGVGILWFMPIHPIGSKNRIGTLGSYYSVKDYLSVNPEFGTIADFKALVDSVHAKGMYVMIDWVGNHTAWDNELTNSHPDWYVKGTNGEFIPPPGTNWSDVIQLDYSKPELRAYMIDAMKFWVNEVKVDGFRCDAVSFMPIDFWSEAIAELKKDKPDLFMLAEDDGPQYEAAGFDMTYAWGLLAFGTGLLKDIAAGKSNANFLNTYSTQEKNNFPLSHYRMYFTSNHDENSWHGTVYEEFGGAAEVFAVFVSTFRGMPLIYSGQEAGLNKRLLFFEKDPITWKSNPFAELYSSLLHLKKNNKALWNGTAGGQLQRVTTSNNPAIFSYIREKDGHKVFVILNVTNSQQTFTLQGNLYVGTYRDVFSNDTVTFSENAEVTLPAWGYKVYEIGSGITDVWQDESMLEDFSLPQNYPNPFNPETNISFTIPREGFVSLTVSNMLGEKVATLINSQMERGRYQVTFNSNDLSSGIYFYSIRFNDLSLTKKMMLLK